MKYEAYILYLNNNAVATVYGKTNAKNLAINASRLFETLVDVIDRETGEVVLSYRNGFNADNEPIWEM